MSLSQLNKLGITLPSAPQPVGAYVPAVRCGNLIFLSGQLPMVNGTVPAQYQGKLGYNIPLAIGQEAARQATLNALAILEATVGLDHIRQIVRFAGHISCVPTFREHPQVLNPSSQLLGDVFGDAGVHARLALGAVSLPLDACVEIELIAEVAV